MSALRAPRFSDDLEKLRDALLAVIEQPDADEVEPGLRSASRFFMIPMILVGKSPDGMPVSPELQQKREERARWALSELARIYLKYERWGPDMQGRAPRAEKVDFTRFGPFAEDARDFWPAFPMFMAFYSASKEGVGSDAALVMWRELQFALMLTRPGKYAWPVVYRLASDLVAKQKPTPRIEADEIVDELMARLAKRQITLRTYVPAVGGDMLDAVARVRDYWFRAMGRESIRARAKLRRHKAREAAEQQDRTVTRSAQADAVQAGLKKSSFPDSHQIHTMDTPSARSRRRYVQKGHVDSSAADRDRVAADVLRRNKARQKHPVAEGKMSLSEAARRSGIPRITFVDNYRAAVKAGVLQEEREGCSVVVTDEERLKVLAFRLARWR